MEARRVPVRGRAAGRDRGDVGERGEESVGDVEEGREAPGDASRRCGRGSCRPRRPRRSRRRPTVAPEAEAELVGRCGGRAVRRGAGQVPAGPGQGSRRGARADPQGAVVQGVHRRRGRLERDRPRARSTPGRRSGPRIGRSSTRCSRPPGPRAGTSRTRRTRSTRSSSSPAAPPTVPDDPTRPPNRRQDEGEGDAGASISRSSGSITRRCGAGAVEGDEVCEIAGLGPDPGLASPASCWVTRSSSSSSPKVSTSPTSPTSAGPSPSRNKSRCGGSHRSAPASGCTRTHRLENDHRDEWVKTKHTRLDETRPALQAPPRPQDPQRLGARRRRRTTTNGPTPRPPPPQNRPPPDGRGDRVASAVRRVGTDSEARCRPAGGVRRVRKPPDLTERSRGSLGP